MANKEKNENEANTKLEQLVNEVIIRRRIEKKKSGSKGQQQQLTTIGVPQTTLYRHSYQVNFRTFFF